MPSIQWRSACSQSQPPYPTGPTKRPALLLLERLSASPSSPSVPSPPADVGWLINSRADCPRWEEPSAVTQGRSRAARGMTWCVPVHYLVVDVASTIHLVVDDVESVITPCLGSRCEHRYTMWRIKWRRASEHYVVNDVAPEHYVVDDVASDGTNARTHLCHRA